LISDITLFPVEKSKIPNQTHPGWVNHGFGAFFHFGQRAADGGVRPGMKSPQKRPKLWVDPCSCSLLREDLAEE
jgi:hypothetical protein